MTNIYFIIGSFGFLATAGVIGYGYHKVFGVKKYKVLKDYKYKDSRIQLIINPQHNVCGHCYDILEEHSEISRFPNCDHHFCEKCILQLIDDSQSNLNPCKMCFKV